jgi:uncharacterized membrane protein
MDKTLISLLSGLGGMFGWGTSDFFANSASEKIGHFRTLFWSQIAGMILMGIFMVVFNPAPLYSFDSLILLVISSVLYTFGYLYFYKAFEIGNVSVVSATINLNNVIAILLAYFFLGQRLSSTQTPAVVLIILGIVLVSVNLRDFARGSVSLLKGVKEAVIASFAFGIFWNLSQLLSEKIGWLPTTFYIKVITIVLLIMMSRFNQKDSNFEKKHLNILPVVILVGILEALAIASVNFGLSVGDLILITPISSALSVVTISLAVIFLKEKITKIQVLGMVLALVGIVVSGI